MGSRRGRNDHNDISSYAPLAAKDFDPEEDEQIGISDGSDLDPDDTQDGFDGREHYVDAGKSKLRSRKTVALGPKYRGSNVTRAAVDTVDEHDPFLQLDGDDSEDSGTESVSEDETNNGGMSSDTDEGNHSQSSDADDDKNAMDIKNGRYSKFEKGSEPVDSNELKRVIAESGNEVSKALSLAAREEVEKGQAMQKQRATFDSLLNTRVKLQKSMVATNSLVGISKVQIGAAEHDIRQTLEAAETAAFNLWSSLTAFRDEFVPVQSGKKRKLASFTTETAREELWRHMETQESESQPIRYSVLERWSKKAQGPSLGKGRLQQSKDDTISMVLKEHLHDSTRLLSRAHTPRSCAPLQLSQRLSHDPKIYDDADFYGLLLKELLEHKAQDAVAVSTVDLGSRIGRDAKTKRLVDTKASKGRKLRYTVHEKLQNFMAPEDRMKWSARQADELFKSLFGHSVALAETHEPGAGDDDSGSDMDAEDAGLLLFGR